MHLQLKKRQGEWFRRARELTINRKLENHMTNSRLAFFFKFLLLFSAFIQLGMCSRAHKHKARFLPEEISLYSVSWLHTFGVGCWFFAIHHESQYDSLHIRRHRIIKVKKKKWGWWTESEWDEKTHLVVALC